MFWCLFAKNSTISTKWPHSLLADCARYHRLFNQFGVASNSFNLSVRHEPFPTNWHFPSHKRKLFQTAKSSLFLWRFCRDRMDLSAKLRKKCSNNRLWQRRWQWLHFHFIFEQFNGTTLCWHIQSGKWRHQHGLATDGPNKCMESSSCQFERKQLASLHKRNSSGTMVGELCAEKCHSKSVLFWQKWLCQCRSIFFSTRSVENI